MTAYEQGFITKCAESLSDEELALLAKYYDTHRDDRPTIGGDIGRYALFGGSLPLTAVYDYNRTGGTQVLSHPFANNAFRSKTRTQKEVDRGNLIAKGLIGGVGALAGGTIGADTDVGAVGGAAIGGGVMLALQHLVQKLAQNRARRHVDAILSGRYDELDKQKQDRLDAMRERLR